jgi:phytoene/squalene synthetase
MTALAPPAAGSAPAEITARSRSNFLAGFVCLGAARRAGMTAIYAFCRVADDAVDDAPDVATGRAHLQFWRDELAAAARAGAATPVGVALQETMRRFGVEARFLDALLDGVATDLEPRGFDDEDELTTYCWRVASAVGRACLPVLGAAGVEAERFADALGQALQRTNILRDLCTDAAAGRVYVPRTWLHELGVDAGWLAGRGPAAVYAADGPVARLCERLGSGAEREFAVARAALRALPLAMRRGLVPARIMGAIYGELLRRLRRRGGELRRPRVRVPGRCKLWLASAVLAGLRA